MISLDLVLYNLEKLKSNIHDLVKDSIDIIAVTKMLPYEVYDICDKLNMVHIGENQAQELKNKFESNLNVVNKKLKYHFIGHLQTNKIKDVVDILFSLDTLHSIKQIEKLNQLCIKKNIYNLPVLLQLNSTNEKNKSGIPIKQVEQVLDITHKCLENNILNLEGLMTIGPTPASSSKEDQVIHRRETQRAFSKTYKMKEFIYRETGHKLHRLSMGMSHDYKIAIEEGSTEIRIGSSLFGARPLI